MLEYTIKNQEDYFKMKSYLRDYIYNLGQIYLESSDLQTSGKNEIIYYSLLFSGYRGRYNGTEWIDIILKFNMNWRLINRISKLVSFGNPNLPTLSNFFIKFDKEILNITYYKIMI